MNEQGAAAGDVWKWVSATLVAILLAGSPAVVQAVRAPSKEDVEEVSDRQLETLVRLAALEVQLAELKAQLQRHEAQDVRR